MNYIFDNKINFNNIEKKILNILKKKFNIEIKNVDNFFNSNIYVKDNPQKDQKKYICMSYFINDIFKKNYKNDIEILENLQNLFKNENIVVLCPGPSYKSLTNNEKKYLIENYITIAVKYVINDLNELNLYPTFLILNDWSKTFKINYDNNLSIIYGYDISQKDFFLNFKTIRKYHHLNSFNLLKQNIDIISWNIREFKKNNIIGYHPMHIMCELVFPLIIHLGCKNIYTCGWDLKYEKNNCYLYKLKDDTELLKNINQLPSELHVLENIKNIFKNKNIYVFKIKKESPLNIDYINIFQ